MAVSLGAIIELLDVLVELGVPSARPAGELSPTRQEWHKQGQVLQSHIPQFPSGPMSQWLAGSVHATRSPLVSCCVHGHNRYNAPQSDAVTGVVHEGNV